MSFWKTLLTLAICLGAPAHLLAQDLAQPADGERPAATYGIWHTESARILSQAGELDLLRSRLDSDLVKTVLRLQDLRQFAQDPNVGREAIRSEASRGNIAGVILLRKAGYEDPSSPEAEATAATYWQALDNDVIFLQTSRHSRQGSASQIHLGLRVPEIFVPNTSLSNDCFARGEEKFICKSPPFELEVAFRQAWMQEVIDRMLPGTREDEEPWVAVEDSRNTRQITMIGRKGASNFKVTITGSDWAQAEIDDLADQIWTWLPRHPVTPVAPVMAWLVILFIVGLIVFGFVKRQRKTIDDSYDVS